MKRLLFALALFAAGWCGAQPDSPGIAKLRVRAEQGLAGAQFNLGEMYANGYDVAKDLTVAAGWYHKSAEQGYGEAAFSLGLLYLQGAGVPKDESEGFAWIAVAAQPGNVTLIKFRDKLTKTLAPDVIAAGQKRSKELLAQIAKRKLAKARATER